MTLASLVTLASGHQMPLVGFGLWKVSADEAEDIVYNAIKIGYRLFDGAYDYQNEREAGRGVRRAIEEGLVKREDIFITTKLWNNYHRREHALAMAAAQSEAWGLGYIDLYLIHFPIALKYVDPEKIKYPCWWTDTEKTKIETEKAPLHETWAALEETVDAGLVRSIGISNAQSQILYEISTYARHPISSLQVEHHPYLVQSELLTLAKEKNITVTAYSSFGPQSYADLPSSFRERTEDIKLLWDLELVCRVAERVQRTSAQVLLRWATQRGVAVIPKSTNPVRSRQNLDITDFELEAEEIEEISKLDKGLRFNDPGHWLQEPLRIFA